MVICVEVILTEIFFLEISKQIYVLVNLNVDGFHVLVQFCEVTVTVFYVVISLIKNVLVTFVLVTSAMVIVVELEFSLETTLFWVTLNDALEIVNFFLVTSILTYLYL